MKSKGSQTEYNKLTKVILGRIDEGNAYPENDLGMLSVIAKENNLLQPTGNLDIEAAKKLVPEISEEIIQTTIKELDQLEKFYLSCGAEVLRPNKVLKSTVISTPHFSTTQFPVFCPRDVIFNFRELVVVSPNLYQSRIFEGQYYNDILLNENRLIVHAPRPNLDESDFDLSGDGEYVTKTNDPVFEAANVLIDGEHNAIYYQISHSGNEAGYQWIKKLISKIYPEVTVYPLHVYKGTHIDTTISILNSETVALNPERIPDPSVLPEPLKNRRHIFPKIEDKSNEDGLSSVWIGMNTFSVRPDLVVVDSDQKLYIEQLQEAGFDVFPHKLTYCDVLEGGHHCTTSDLEREESY